MSGLFSFPPTAPAIETVLVLPDGFSCAALAASCRETALAFMNESSGWGKAQLAMWLTGPYALVTQYAKKEETPSLLGAGPIIKDVDVRLVDRIIKAARTEVVDMLRQVIVDESSSFVLRALIAGTVVRCEDGFREPAWAPAAGTTRLADRVLSLFAVDYLVRGADYENDLAVCSSCSHIAFDAVMRRRGVCPVHASGGPRIRRPTLPYPGLESA